MGLTNPFNKASKIENAFSSTRTALVRARTVGGYAAAGYLPTNGTTTPPTETGVQRSASTEQAPSTSSKQ
ncbi:hypothetical protein AAVH_25540 [Aphelenchoides avenae]|nr:hypothetical protein AAVH_25540 [Aphelenchus avenae]